MTQGRGYVQPVAVAILLCSIPFGAATQSVDDGGFAVGVTYTERLLWEDDETSALSDLGLTLTTKTRNQSLAFSISGSLDKSLDGGVSASWRDPRLSLAYGLENRNNALSFDLDYRRADIDAFTPLNDQQNAPLVLDSGTREDFSTRLGLEFGRDAAFGGSFSLGYRETNYLDTAAPNLVNSTNTNASLVLRFEIDPRITARTSLKWSDLDRDGGTDVERKTFSAGASFLVTKALTADVDIGVTQVIQSGATPRDVDEGLFYTLALTQDLQNGTLGGSLTSDLDENGRRTTLRLDRNLELRDGSLRFGLGFSRDGETNDTNPLYSLSYVKEMPRGQFDASLQQSYSSNSTGAETLNSNFQMGLRQDLTPRDTLGTRLSWRQSDTQGAGETQQTSLSLDYSRSLTEDWALTSGYTHTRNKAANGTKNSDDKLFIGLRTSLAWRP